MKTHGWTARALAALLLLGSCGGGKPAVKTEPGDDEEEAPAPRPVKRPVKKPEPPAPPAVTAQSVQLEVLAVLEVWKRAQAEGKADVFLDLYDEMSFRAVAPAGKGKQPVEMDFATWRDGRASTLTGPVGIAAERPVIETWLDAGSGLEHGVSQVRFFERYENKAVKQAMRGVKILRFKREDDGKQRIVHEEVVSSEKGFSGGKKEKQVPWTIDATVLPSPVTLNLVALTVSAPDAENPEARVLLELTSGELSRVINLDNQAGQCTREPETKGQLAGMKCFWAGLGIDYRITRKKDVVVIERQFSEDGPQGGALPWTVYANVNLVAGAELVVEGAPLEETPEPTPEASPSPTPSPSPSPTPEASPVIKPGKVYPTGTLPKDKGPTPPTPTPKG